MFKKFIAPPFYEVLIDDKTGDVKVLSNSKHAKGRELSQYYNPSGYLRVKMWNTGIEIHRLVAKYFLGERPPGLCVNHIDGNKLNNRPGNLEYVTIAENIRHSVRMGLHVSSDPKRSGRYKDGRAVDVKKYKSEWYQKNKERILGKQKTAYRKRKEGVFSSTAKPALT